MILEVIGEVRTMNRQRGKSRWWEDHDNARFWRTAFNAAARAARSGPTWQGVDIEVIHLYHGNRPDIGACMPSAKAAIDGLVDARLIPDDTPDYVLSLRFHVPEKRERSGLRLIITKREAASCGSKSMTSTQATPRSSKSMAQPGIFSSWGSATVAEDSLTAKSQLGHSPFC